MSITVEQLAVRLTWKWLCDRCVEEGDCLLWQHACNSSGQPKYSFKVAGTQNSRQMRQVVWAMAGNPSLRAGQVLTMTCDEQSCLNHKHMRPTTRAAVIKKTSQHPDVKRRVTLAGAQHHRPLAKITMEQARYIRECEKTLTALSEELGVSVAWVSKIRRGEAWRELRASPFAGLGA